MAMLQRFSLLGFRREFALIRQIEARGESYICRAALHRGSHRRRPIDGISSAVPVEQGLSAARERNLEQQKQLLTRWNLGTDFVELIDLDLSRG